jgi:hypothetical protein
MSVSCFTWCSEGEGRNIVSQYPVAYSLIFIRDEFLMNPSRHYQKKKVVGLERGPLSLVRTTEELLDRKVAAPV